MSDDDESVHPDGAVAKTATDGNDDSLVGSTSVNFQESAASGDDEPKASTSSSAPEIPADGGPVTTANALADSIPSDFKSLNDHDAGDKLATPDQEPTPNKTTSSDSTNEAISGSSYRDFSHVPPTDTSSVASIFKAASAKEPTFPAKLHMILSNPQFEDIVAWMPHGRSWRILKPDVFEDRVLPLFFCHCRLSSFMRQVNGWGFKRIKHGPDYNSYYNEQFLRGLPHLVERMRRESVSAKSKGGAVEDEPAPDLYKISEENPLPSNPTVAEHLQRAAAGNMPPMGMANPVTPAARGMQPGMPGGGHMALGMPQGGVMQPGDGMPGNVPSFPGGGPMAGSGRGAPGSQAEMLHAFRNGRMNDPTQRFGGMGQPNAMGYGRGGAFLPAAGGPPVQPGSAGQQQQQQMQVQQHVHSNQFHPQASQGGGVPPSFNGSSNGGSAGGGGGNGAMAQYEMQRRMQMGVMPGGGAPHMGFRPGGFGEDPSFGANCTPGQGMYHAQAPNGAAPNPSAMAHMDIYGRMAGGHPGPGSEGHFYGR